MVYVDNHIITLNSTDGTLLNGTFKSNINFAFTGLLKDDVNIIRTYITLLNAQIPVSFYVIDATNNTLLIYVLDPPTGNVINQLSVSIPIGNYNSGTLITALNIAMVSAFISLTVTINPVNGILTFANGSSSFDYAIQSNNYGSTLALILGIGNTSVINSILIGNNSSTTLPFPLNLLGKTKLLINSTNLNNVAYTSFGLGFTTTIATVPVNVPPYSLIQFSTAVDQQKNILTNRVLDNIDIQILDTDNRFINFNNVDWSLTIVLSIEKIDANKFHIQSFNDYLGNEKQPIQPEEIVLNPPEQDKELEFLMN
jgi:hypothetical protein